jgi:hypothetical protein
MGLCCSHDAFEGSYISFNWLRQFVCNATGGTFGPHYVFDEFGRAQQQDGRYLRLNDWPDERWQFGDGYDDENSPGLYEFLCHSDCDGSLSPEMCQLVADDLERLMPRMEAMKWSPAGCIAHQGGFVAVVRQFIAGCRAAAAANEPLEFS